jgi:predicted transcriptional regulator
MKIKGRRWLVAISVIAIILFFAMLLLVFMGFYEEEPMGPPNLNFRRIPIHNLWISPILLVVGIVPLSYYLIMKRVEENTERTMKVISKLMGNMKSNPTKPSKTNDKNIILKFLNFNERKVLEKLIEKKGEVLQSEISRIEGMDKLKTHRAIRNLELKGIIKAENYGKTKRIVLSKDIGNIMLK